MSTGDSIPFFIASLYDQYFGGFIIHLFVSISIIPDVSKSNNFFEKAETFISNTKSLYN